MAAAGQSLRVRRVTRIGYVVYATGKFDAAAAEALQRMVRDLVDAGGREVFLDLSAVQAVTTAAVDAIAALAAFLARLDGGVTLTARRRRRGEYVLKRVEAGSVGSMFGVHPRLDETISGHPELADGAGR